MKGVHCAQPAQDAPDRDYCTRHRVGHRQIIAKLITGVIALVTLTPNRGIT
jgi:hypothetical protein